MPAITGYAEAVGTFVDSWEDGVVEPYKNQAPILAEAKMNEVALTGGVYHVATRLTFEGGQSFAPTQVQPGDSASVPYVGARSGQTPDAKIEGAQIHARSRITYEAIARSAKSVSDTAPDRKKAVRAATMLVAGGLMEGTIKKAETLMLHGRRGIGQLDSAVDGSNVVATTYEGTSGFAVDLSISPSSWSESIFAMFEGHTFDIFGNASGVPTGTKVNVTANSLLASGVNQTGFVLIAVNPATPLTNGTASGRILRLWHSAGTAGAWGTGAIGGWTTPASGAQVEHVCFEGGGPANEFVGMTAMARNVGSLFNLDATKYGMSRGNFQDSVGNLRLSTLMRLLKRPIDYGAGGKLIRAVVPTELFIQFANDESTLRRYATSTQSAEGGFDSLTMHLPHRSTLEILGHSLQKDGEVLAYVPQELIRVGSQDLDFVQRNGGNRKDQLLLEVADRPGSEVRLFGQFAPYAYVNRHMLHLSGVTY